MNVFIEYEILHKIQIYNDIAILSYKLWGEEWEVDVEELNVNINLKSNKGVQYFIEPPNVFYEEDWGYNSLILREAYVSSGVN